MTSFDPIINYDVTLMSRGEKEKHVLMKLIEKEPTHRYGYILNLWKSPQPVLDGSADVVDILKRICVCTDVAFVRAHIERRKHREREI